MVLILCFGLVLVGCPKKTMVKEEPSVKKEEGLAKREGTKEMKPEGGKEFEKSLVARKEPGIKGEVFESHFLKTFTSTLTNTTSVQEMHPS